MGKKVEKAVKGSKSQNSSLGASKDSNGKCQLLNYSKLVVVVFGFVEVYDLKLYKIL